MRTTKLFYALLLMTFLFGVFSCNMEDISEITAIEVTHENQAQVVLIGDTFVFQVKANNNTDVTNESYFKIDDVTIDGNTFPTDMQPKEYKVQAFYKGIASEPIRIFGADGFPKNVLIEDYTGTWCGNCPRVSYAISQVEEQTERFIPVAIHISDEYTFPGAVLINDEFGITSYPNARLNRIHKWMAPEPDNINQAVSHTGIAPLGLAISSTLNGSALQVACSLKFTEDITHATKLVMYIVEDALISDQENYTDYYGGEAIITNFEHNEVLRDILTDYLGDVVPLDQTQNGNIYTYNLSNTLTDRIENTDKIHLVAFVVHAETNEVLNARQAAIGVNQTFE